MEDKKISKPKIFIFIIIVISFLLISYIISKSFASKCSSDMTYDKTYKKCIPICKSDQTYDDNTKKCVCNNSNTTMNLSGDCVTNCTNGQQICGNGCYDKKFQHCLDNSKVCDDFQFNTDTRLCCKDSEIFSQKNKKCEQCDNFCQGKCCPDGHKCIGGSFCCLNSQVHQSKTGEEVCCNNWAKNGGEDGSGQCCDDSQKVSQDGKDCLTPCGNQDCNFSSGETCEQITFHNDDGSIRQQQHKCLAKNKCQTSTIGYDPPNVVNKIGDTGIPVCKLTNSNDPSEPLASCANDRISKYTKSANLTLLDNCETPQNNCEFTMSEQKGMKTISLDNKECTGTFVCGGTIGTNEVCGDCPYGKGDTKCCYDGDKYNGLLCRGGQCHNNKCYNGWQIIKTNGKMTLTDPWLPPPLTAPPVDIEGDIYKCEVVPYNEHDQRTSYTTKQDCIDAISKGCGPDFVAAGIDIDKLGCFRKPPIKTNPYHKQYNSHYHYKDLNCATGIDENKYIAPQSSQKQENHGYCIDKVPTKDGKFYCDTGCYEDEEKKSHGHDGNVCSRDRPYPLLIGPGYYGDKNAPYGWISSKQYDKNKPNHQNVYSFNNEDPDGPIGYCGFPDPLQKGIISEDPPDLTNITQT